MDDFTVFRNNFDECIINLVRVLQRYKDFNLVFNWENFHFMVEDGIILGHKVSSIGLEMDKAKIKVIEKITTNNKCQRIRSFLNHIGFYRRFITDFSKMETFM